MSISDFPTAVDGLVEQAEELCDVHDHITRIIADLDIPPDSFSDQYSHPGQAQFDFEPVIRMFLYQHAREFNDSELTRRLTGTAYVFIRFRLSRSPTQQAVNYIWRRRLSLADRRQIKATACAIREIAANHDLISPGEPRLDPGEIDDAGVTDDQIMRAIRIARDRGLSAFDTDRAANTTYPDEVFFERQAYLNLADVGTTTPRRRFDRLSDRAKTPHGDTHLRTMKKVGAADEQTTLDDFADGDQPPDWDRLREAILEPFHEGIGCLLDDVTERGGVRQPVIAAIDVTHWEFYPSPYKDDEDIEWDDEPIIVNGDEKVPKDDFPEMVSGDPDHRRSYKFATLTIVGEDTPIVLAIEPVRETSAWEADVGESTPKTAFVNRLMEQAEQHVDIHKVFADREFDAHGVRDELDRHGVTYLIPKKKYAADWRGIEQIDEHSAVDVAVEREVPLWVDGRKHKTSIIYVPSTEEEEGQYAVFTTNRDLSPDEAIGFTSQYRQRWVIENEYKTIKKHFLPTTASTDYRVRLLYFVLGVVMYNVWRLTNLLLREAVDVDLGDPPPLRAGEVVELIGFCLAPGG
nr:transposase [Halococcus morrhuae]